MTSLFLYGTLRHEPLLAAVAGGPVPVRDAVMPGHIAVHAGTESFPILVARAGAEAPGLLAEFDDEQIARLTFYEGPEGYALKQVGVLVDGSPVTAFAFLPEAAPWPPGKDWDFAQWQESWGAIITRAATEMMAARAHGQSAQEVDARLDIILARAQAHENTIKWQRPRTVGVPMGRDRATLHETRPQHLGFFTLDTLSVRHDRFDGGSPLDIERTIFNAGEAVTLLPYDPQSDQVLLLEQFRAAPFAKGDPEPWLLEPIAGIVDAGETVEQSARREAVEEAGLRVGEIHFVARYYPSPGATAQVLYSYVGIADLSDEVATGGGLAHEGEDIAVHVVPYEVAHRMLETGELAAAPMILSMQWLAMNRDRLRAEAS